MKAAPATRYPPPRPPTGGWLGRMARTPLVRLAVYYAVLVGVAAWLISVSEVVRSALVSPAIPILDEGAALVTGQSPPISWSDPPAMLETTLARMRVTLLVILGALALAAPVAWVYMATKRLRYDPGLVRSVVLLPIAVAGILLVVKNSLALAFSLAGIVAAVRFRNTLKDPQDAVYIFLTIAIGISAGVQALDVGLVVSVTFNLAVLGLWHFQVGSIYAGRYERTGVLSIGDSSLLVARTPEECSMIRRRALGEADAMEEVDGVLLIHTGDAELARHTIQNALAEATREWQLLSVSERGGKLRTVEYLVRLAKKASPADLLGALDQWSAQVTAAEYVPYRARTRPRSEAERVDE